MSAPMRVFSTNERAERLMGRRLTPAAEERGVLAIDLPCELGYQCPVHQRAGDQALDWSEYAGFLWCADCNRDYPSALCVPIVGEAERTDKWWNHGPDDAVSVFLDTVERAVARAVAEAQGMLCVNCKERIVYPTDALTHPRAAPRSCGSCAP